MNTSGLVLDIHDDFQGDVLRSIYPSQDDIPETVKIASSMSATERQMLPDDAFALVLINDGQKMRKYACIDAGNTELGVEFFLKTGHKLPAEAQKTAAENLVQACGWYDIEPPEELKKIAFLGALLAAIPAMEAASAIPGQVRQGLAENEAMGGGGRIITSPERSAIRAQMGKQADVVGTDDMPNSTPAGASSKPSTSKTVILKSAAEMGRLVSSHGGEKSVSPETNESMSHGEQPKSEPQAKSMHPHVDVTNKHPPVLIHEKKASVYALPSIHRYPLDSYLQVLAAAEYFEKHASKFDWEQRREYGVNLVKRAGEIGVRVGESARQYGASGYANDDVIKVGYELRKKQSAEGEDLSLLLEQIYEKRASIDPDLFAATLYEFDKLAHIDLSYDRGVPDPAASTFGQKVAEEWSEVIGNDMVTESDLKRLGKIGMRALKSTFSEEFAMDFKKNPVDIFKSLPLDQKKVIMRMAIDNSGPGIELTA